MRTFNRNSISNFEDEKAHILFISEGLIEDDPQLTYDYLASLPSDWFNQMVSDKNWEEAKKSFYRRFITRLNFIMDETLNEKNYSDPATMAIRKFTLTSITVAILPPAYKDIDITEGLNKSSRYPLLSDLANGIANRCGWLFRDYESFGSLQWVDLQPIIAILATTGEYKNWWGADPLPTAITFGN